MDNFHHERYMRRAIELASNVPDVPFGAVIVDRSSGKIVAEGWNKQKSCLLGEEEIEYDAEEIEDMRKDDIRQCTRDLLLVERARKWLLGDEEA